VKDAEAHADEDKKFNELINARNQGDQMVHGVEKSLKDLGEQVQADEKKQIEDAIAALREVLKGDDKDAITAKSEALAQVSSKLMERVYAAKNAEAGAAGAGAQAGAGEAKKDGDVVDAEFTEVKDKK
ncbi:MAG TPA: Hsp70 family protein, partial [Nevskiaceae bacterium]|nr:Hsp70 family protein [Nevskiaceae bacterium]